MIYSGLRLLLGVSSSIAAHRALDVASTVIKGGGEVRVVMTPTATRLVGAAAFVAITGRPVITSLWESAHPGEMDHLASTKWANVFCIAPATAATLARLATGLADDAVATFALAWPKPLVIAPAMNPTMYASIPVQEHVATLHSRGHRLVGPVEGLTACGDNGLGRMSSVEDILIAIVEAFRAGTNLPSLEGRRLLITSGPTREFADPVRCITNPSTGRMGVALARAALACGGSVVLVTGPCELPMPAGAIQVERITTAEEMRDVVLAHLSKATDVIFAAAVSDWRPETRMREKQKKDSVADEMVLRLVRTPDVAGEAAKHRRAGQVFVGFAAESHNLIANARGKLQSKGFDLVVANPVTEPGAGFGTDTNHAWLVTGRSEREVPTTTKDALAVEILREMVRVEIRNSGEEYPLGLSDA
jgi:phosphopantothenoylcysteine decarboxylase/phosphopantothenate--cysteine ligase